MITRYRWWTVRAWWTRRDIGVKLGPVTVAILKSIIDDRWVPGVYVLNGRWFWERW